MRGDFFFCLFDMVVIEHSIIFGVPKCLVSIIIIPLKLLVVIYENVKILFLARLVVTSMFLLSSEGCSFCIPLKEEILALELLYLNLVN